MQNDPVVSKASELLRLGAMPTPDELRSGKVYIGVLCLRIVILTVFQNLLDIDISSRGSEFIRG